MSDDELVIWWTTQADCEAIGERLPGKVPRYLRDEYQSRLGRSGRGRLWASLKLNADVKVDPWPETPLGRALSHAAGIVLRSNDRVHVAQLPGVLTDTSLQRVPYERPRSR